MILRVAARGRLAAGRSWWRGGSGGGLALVATTNVQSPMLFLRKRKLVFRFRWLGVGDA